MKLKPLHPRQALNKAFLKVKPIRTDIERFKTNLIQLLDNIRETESEEYHKNLVTEFLKSTYYAPHHFINTKGRNDLVIHNGQNANTTVGVIIEVKKPTNKAEMISTHKLNVKAFQELVLYYLRERVNHTNIEIKHLIATNINEWFIFDEQVFERLFHKNTAFVEQFKAFEAGKKSTDVFYKEIAEPYISKIISEIEFTHFKIQDFQNHLRNKDKADDNSLIALFKLLSPEHLLKLPFTNDSNSLDKRFYSELLHIIGLSETKDGSKKLIERNKIGERHTGSILEDIIIELDSLDKISRFDNPNLFGNTLQEQLFNVALELSITWINRILFLKLLEAQLITYHKGDKSFAFLNLEKIKNYGDLNSLFFQVLARKHDERNPDVKKAFEKIPYLNSSLFEPTDLEHSALFISNLKGDKTIPIYSQTILKDQQGKKQTGNLPTLQYLFEFLEAYDFGAEGGEEIQEDNKTLINASVLGLIFEKINGYKEGSYFTPGFITMYMSRETLRLAVVQKFNEAKGWNCKSFEELKEDLNNEIKKGDRKEVRKQANTIIKGLKICDPAVGSGHFLVSALNELITIKYELNILVDAQNEAISDYMVEVVNDELIVSNLNHELFEYNPKNPKSERIQKTLFHEKQTIIENCLFGVDINPNSVKICRLRLWIELLKNAYYKNPTELETLPNIDINIKCGNSLVSRFALNADLKQALKKSKWSIKSYQVAVSTYRNAESKEQKREMEKLIADIKSDFRSEILFNHPKIEELNKVRGLLDNKTAEGKGLFALGEKEKAKWNKEIKELSDKFTQIEAQIEEIKANKIYENAFEWRFEFPEVLNNDGDFVGFDVVIGNPPYIPLESFKINEREFMNLKFSQLERKYESSVPFILDGLKYLNKKGYLSFIAPITWQTGENYSKFRKYFFENYGLLKIINLPFNIFEDAFVDTALYFLSKELNNKYEFYSFEKKAKIEKLENLEFTVFDIISIKSPDYKVIIDKTAQNFYRFSSDKFVQLGAITKSTQGLSGSLFPEIQQAESEFHFPFLSEGNVYNYCFIKEKVYFTDLNNKRNLIQFYLGEPKILIRRIINRQNRLSVTFYNEKMVFKKDINPFIPITKNFDCYFLTGILASKLLSFIYLRTSTIANKDDFRQTTLTELRKLPIPNITLINQKPISNIVKKIIEIKTKNINENTNNLESQIDQLVYRLYDLTPDEIAIVESSVGGSKIGS